MKAEKIRLLFAADEISMSLQRIIEFLNEQMNNTEVLGLEIKQYVSDGNMKTISTQNNWSNIDCFVSEEFKWFNVEKTMG